MKIKLYDPLNNYLGEAEVRSARAFPRLVYVEKTERGNIIPSYYVQKDDSPSCDLYVLTPLSVAEAVK